MLTTPSAWESFQFRTDARYAIIVKLTDGIDTWYFGDMEIDWGAIHVYGILLSHTGIAHKIDVFSKKWAVGDFSATFANLPYRNVYANWFRPSDDIVFIRSREATVYLLCGEKATGLSDCLIRFKGYVEEIPKFDENTITVKIIDRTNQFDFILPDTYVTDIYTSGVPEASQDKRIPIVYGEFKHDYTGDQLGLTKGIPITYDFPPKCVFSNHILKDFTKLWYQHPSLRDPGYYYGDGLLLLEDDSDRGTSEVPNDGIEYHIIPDTSDTRGYVFNSQEKPTDVANAYDADGSTYAIVKDNIDDDGTAMEGEGRFGFVEDRAIEDLLKFALVEPGGGYWGIRYKAEAHNGASISTATVAMYYKSDGETDTAHGGWAMTLNNTFRNTATTSNTLVVDEKNRFYKLASFAATTTGGNGSTDDQNLLDIMECWLRILTPSPDIIDYLWGEMTGRKFGSWIDIGGRDDNYDEGDLIEDPAFIIESLLRDEIGLIDAQIDEGSFDDAANSSVKARINITKAVSVNRIIRQLCEQSTFAFFYSAVDKAKLIPLNESSPVTDRTIPFSHIKQNSLKVSVSHPKVNKLIVESRWQGQKNKYQDIDVVENGASQSAIGIKEYSVKWPNIAGTSREHIANHLVGDGGSLWAFTKTVIEFETAGFINADVEIGDWIELDDETWNAQLKSYGASWSGKQFLVTEITQKQDGTRIKAIAI